MKIRAEPTDSGDSITPATSTRVRRTKQSTLHSVGSSFVLQDSPSTTIEARSFVPRRSVRSIVRISPNDDALKVTPEFLQAQKRMGRKSSMLTAYDAHDAALIDRAGVSIALVGDSVGPFRLGKPINEVTMEDMLATIARVRSGLPPHSRVMVLGDMPEGSYPVDDLDRAIENAKRLMAAGADTIKVEGGREIEQVVRALVAAKIPVMGHIGSTPQTTGKLLGDRMLGALPEEAASLSVDAHALEAAGVFAILIKGVEPSVSAQISKSSRVPLLGIESGINTDGQGTNTDMLLKRAKPSGPNATGVACDVSADRIAEELPLLRKWREAR